MIRGRKRVALAAVLAGALGAGVLAAYVLARPDGGGPEAGGTATTATAGEDAGTVAETEPPATSAPEEETEPPEPGTAAEEPPPEAPPAPPPPGLVKGLFDDPAVYGTPYQSFPILQRLGVQAVRAGLYWGGDVVPVSKRKPARLDPEDRSFDWTVYDRAVLLAAGHGIDVYFYVFATPAWANGGQGANVPPDRMKDLENFVFVAATRYSGRYTRPDGVTLPAVRHWLAWNEPNNPIFLRNQFRPAGGRWEFQSPVDYARICNAVVAGVRKAQRRSDAGRGQVACGITAPRGNNRGGGARPSVAPLTFMRRMHAAGARGFDAYGHNAYTTSRDESPSTRPSQGALTIGNIGELIDEVTRLWGNKRIWITEFAYETDPPDRRNGVPPDVQARYLAEAFRLAKRHERIDAFFWFLLRDEPHLQGWQSGLLRAGGRKKPAFETFRTLR